MSSLYVSGCKALRRDSDVSLLRVATEPYACNMDVPIDEVTAPGDITKSSSTLRPKEKRTLWIGDLDRAYGPVDDAYVKTHMFYEFRLCITSVRICRDRVTREPSFGFVEFQTQQDAQYILQHMNGRFVPGKMHKYKLNWANFNLTETQPSRVVYSRPPQLHKHKLQNGESHISRQGTPCGPRGGSAVCPPENSTSIWVGSLDPSTCREEVEELFQQRYNSVCFVKLIVDPNTGVCKGFGFVHFRDSEEAERALEEMNGAVCRGRRIRVNKSNTSRNGMERNGQVDVSLHNAMHKIYSATAAEAQRLAFEYCGGFIPTKRKRGVLTAGETSKIMIRGLDSRCSEDDLKRHFSPFGEVLLVRLSAGGNKAYITYAEMAAATNAIHCMNGAYIGTTQVTVIEATNGQYVDNISEDNVGIKSGQVYTRDVNRIYNQGICFEQEQHHRIQDENQTFPYVSNTYSMEWAPYWTCGIKKKCNENQKNNTKKAMKQTTEEELNGGIFQDIDPCLILSDLLPSCVFTFNAITLYGSLERYIFQPEIPCQIQIPQDNLNKRFTTQHIYDEYTTCITTLHAALRRQLVSKVQHRLPLQPTDYESLYTTTFDASFESF